MPSTPRAHFDDDFARAMAICTTAKATNSEPLRADLARSAVVFGVGALDAYLCDAFVDCLARTLKGCRRKSRALPEGYENLPLPAGPMLATTYKSRPNWGLRMAARAIMERENLQQVRRVRGLLNPALPKSRALWEDIGAEFVAVDRKRLTGITEQDFKKLPSKKRPGAQRAAASHTLTRIEAIVQRRHDIAHNCDRPRTSVQRMKPGTAANMLRDIEAFVSVLDSYLDQHRLY